ncbi:MAG: ROK family protein [Clostridia bacterium]
MKNYLAIDIGGTAVKGGIVTEKGTIVLQYKLAASFDNYKTKLFETVKKAILQGYELADKAGVEVEGLAISATGDVDSNELKIIGGGGNIPDWENIDVKAEVAAILHREVKMSLVNDANCAAIGEKWLGAAKEFKDCIVYTIGTGIGGGIFVDGKILNGSRGFAGNIGHMVIADGQRECACGNSGCFEKMASTKALLLDAKAVGFEGGGEQLFAEAKTNEKLQEVIERFYHYHGIAMGSLIHIFNPEAIIVGGGISAQGDSLIDNLRSHIKAHTLPHFFERVQVLKATLGNDAGIIGATKYFIDKFND